MKSFRIQSLVLVCILGMALAFTRTLDAKITTPQKNTPSISASGTSAKTQIPQKIASKVPTSKTKSTLPVVKPTHQKKQFPSIKKIVKKPKPKKISHAPSRKKMTAKSNKKIKTTNTKKQSVRKSVNTNATRGQTFAQFYGGLPKSQKSCVQRLFGASMIRQWSANPNAIIPASGVIKIRRCVHHYIEY